MEGPTVTALTNGNFVVAGIGTATWGSGTAGVSGTVSASNSFVEGGTPGGVDVTPLANGNYVLDFIGWSGETGAVAWGNGMTGSTGTVSAANSLLGSNFGDFVGGNGGSSGGVTALADGNYVVNSPFWNNDDGAVTWGNGTTGVTGLISATNSLIGGVAGGSSADAAELTVTPIPTGNYIVSDSQWNGGLGEVTWGSGTSGVDGVVSAANSLVGSNPYDAVGENITVLSNGNYVVDSPDWNSSAGAVTWGSGTAGVSGPVSATNSLVGGDQGNQVGTGKENGGGIGGVTALANGNYVVDSVLWNNATGRGDVGRWDDRNHRHGLRCQQLGRRQPGRFGRLRRRHRPRQRKLRRGQSGLERPGRGCDMGQRHDWSHRYSLGRQQPGGQPSVQQPNRIE